MMRAGRSVACSKVLTRIPAARGKLTRIAHSFKVKLLLFFFHFTLKCNDVYVAT